MKVRRQLAALEPMIMDAITGLAGEAWYQAPARRWSVAQMLSHVAGSADMLVAALENRRDRTDLVRRATPKQHLLRHLVLGMGPLPRGRGARGGVAPTERPDPELAAAQLRMALQRLEALVETLPEDQQQRVFVRHPVIGDLNLPEWVRFLYVHHRHYAEQIGVRRRWLDRQQGKWRRMGERRLAVKPVKQERRSGADRRHPTARKRRAKQRA